MGGRGQEGGLSRATGVTPSWLGGWHCPIYWVWSAQIPGGGRNLALPVWLSPDTRGPATKKPRQNKAALHGGQPVRNTLFVQGLEVEEAGSGQAGPGHPYPLAGQFPREAEGGGEREKSQGICKEGISL